MGNNVCDFIIVGDATDGVIGLELLDTTEVGVLTEGISVTDTDTGGGLGILPTFEVVGYRVMVGIEDGVADGEGVGMTVGKREGAVGEEVVMVKGANCRSILLHSVLVDPGSVHSNDCVADEVSMDTLSQISVKEPA